MSLVIEHLGELYYRSHSIQFDIEGDGFLLSAHQDNPDLARSPYYLHYPKPGEKGYELMPELVKYTGMALFKLAVEMGIEGNTYAGVPDGADPLAEATARYGKNYPDNISHFKKQQCGHNTKFSLLDGTFSNGNELTAIDDHTYGGRNKRLFQIAAEGYGYRMTHILNVVDREQGAEAVMANHGVFMRSLFTITELFEYGLAERHITQDAFDSAMEHKQQNAIPTAR